MDDLASLKAENARLRKLFSLAAHDVIFFGSYDPRTATWPDCGEFFTPCVNLNDTFAYASADGEELTDDQIDRLIRLHNKFGHDGVVAWASMVRGSEPLPRYRNDKYRAARDEFSAGEKP